MKQLFLFFFVLISALANSADQKVLAPVNGGTWRASINKALTDCVTSGGGLVYDDPPQFAGEERRIDGDISSPYAWVLAGSPTCSVSLRLRGYYSYYGPSQWLLRTLGLKWGEIEMSGVRLRADILGLVLVDGDATHPSSTSITLKLQGWTGYKRNCFVQIGSGTSNDITGVTLQGCNLSSEIYNTGATVGDKLANVHLYGCVGVRDLGYNTCGVYIRDSWLSGFDVAISTSLPGQPSGAAPLVVDGGGGSFNNLAFLTDGYQDLRASNQQWENGHAMWVGGNPLVSGRGTGKVTFDHVQFRSYNANLTGLGYTDPGVLFAANGNMGLRITACTGYGNVFDPSRGVLFRSNLSPGGTATLDRSVVTTATAMDGSVTVVK